LAGRPLLQSREGVAQTVAPRGTTGNAEATATRRDRPAPQSSARSSRATSARLLTGVEMGSQEVARGFAPASREGDCVSGRASSATLRARPQPVDPDLSLAR
jgi:hypothetical protein